METRLSRTRGMPVKKHIAKDQDHVSSIAFQHKLLTHAQLWSINKSKLSGKKRSDPNVLFKGDRVVSKGDELDIPTIDDAPKSGSIDSDNKFVIDMSELWLRVRIVNNDLSPIKGAQYVLTFPDITAEIKGVTNEKGQFTGKTDDKGHIEVKIPDYFKKRDAGYANTALLEVRVPAEDSDGKEDAKGDDPEGVVYGQASVRGEVAVAWKLSIGALNPIEELAPDERCVSGCQQRLNNLNFNTGPIDGIVGPNTDAAVKAFKKMFKIGSVKGKEGQPNQMMQASLRRAHDTEEGATPPAETAQEAPPMASEH